MTLTLEKFFPLPGHYGVIQIDPVAMVEHLDDKEALAQAREMHTRKYIVYLVDPIELPWPERPWYGYYALLVGPCLRQEDEAKAITSDMCIAIAPNIAHPTGRPPLLTQPLFPFSNCYHWADSETRIRIRSGVEFDEAHAVSLPSSTQIDMQDLLDEDLDRAYDALEERTNAARAAAEQQSIMDPGKAERSDQPNVGGVADHDASGEHWLGGGSDKRSACDCLSSRSSSRPSSPTPLRARSLSSLEEIEALDPFGLQQGEEVIYFPLVDFCFDLADHLTQNEIPSPVDYWKEEDQIVAIIKAAQERALRAPAVPPQDTEPHQPTEGVIEQKQSVAKPHTLVIERALRIVLSQIGPVHRTPVRRDDDVPPPNQPIKRQRRDVADALHIRIALQYLGRGIRRVSRAMTLPSITYWP